MATTDNISTERTQLAASARPSYSTPSKWPSKGRLKWIGGNLALDYPVIEEAMTDTGEVIILGLGELLQRLDEFEGQRCGTSIQDNLIACCFSAYEYGLLTAEERESFEGHVRAKIDTMGHFEAARRLILSQ